LGVKKKKEEVLDLGADFVLFSGSEGRTKKRQQKKEECSEARKASTEKRKKGGRKKRMGRRGSPSSG